MHHPERRPLLPPHKGEGRLGGSRGGGTAVPFPPTPTTDPSPQGEGRSKTPQTDRNML